MLQPFCDECDKPLLKSDKMIIVNEITFFTKSDPPRGARNLHFCNQQCLHGWVVKAQDKPNIIQLGAQ
tara:strand:- start:284 stop:487 length:204 start_codon:yes stop_codon:yes gene_type:complete